jgi:hypothetical protein
MVMSGYRKTSAIATATAASFALSASLSIFIQAAGPSLDEMRSAARVTATAPASTTEPARQIRMVYPVIALRSAVVAPAGAQEVPAEY